jgi:hypothetical protein
MSLYFARFFKLRLSADGNLTAGLSGTGASPEEITHEEKIFAQYMHAE